MEVPQEILSRYMDRRKRDLEACLANLAEARFTELEKVGHQLKGNGVTFGHDELSIIGSQLEAAAASKDIASLESALKDFSIWINEQIS
jgi:HPt (histidine-containing phosphotransfer) domain-containing protein